jgi:hypothetical protein
MVRSLYKSYAKLKMLWRIISSDCNHDSVGSEIVTVVTKKNTALWDVMFADVSGECTASIFRVKVLAKYAFRKDLFAACFFACCLLALLFSHEDGVSTLLESGAPRR